MTVYDLEPKSVFRFFAELSSIPHGSGNTEKISRYCARFAEERGLEYHRDALNNIIIKKPGTAGYEDLAPVIIQGHLDMVCQKTPETQINFLADGLEVLTDGEYVFANGTTLGADDGIALAYALAILDASDIPHPPIEAVFTSDEETGMYGAAGLDTSVLHGRTLLNIDSEEEGVFTVSCAGGARCAAEAEFPISICTGSFYMLKISGLLGGHSGVEIDKDRGNAIHMMAQLISFIIKRCAAHLVSMQGGSADNAIPDSCTAIIATGPGMQDDIAECCNQYMRNANMRLSCSGERAMLHVTPLIAAPAALSAEDSYRVMQLINNSPGGVMAMSDDIPGLVETSYNLGIIELSAGKLRMSYSLRSNSAAGLQRLETQLLSVICQFGFKGSSGGHYPPWEYRAESPLRERLCAIYEKLYGEKPRVSAIHAGLECGLFSSKMPELDCISFGPNILDIHTPKERLDIASAQRTWQLILEYLKSCKEGC